MSGKQARSRSMRRTLTRAKTQSLARGLTSWTIACQVSDLNHQSLNPKNHETLNMLATCRVLGTIENTFYISVLYKCHIAYAC